jgi:hypothetical protein
LVGSASWRLTKPLRWIETALKRAAARIGR